MELDITKACGPDRIPSRLLKECANEITLSLCMMFNTLLKTACLPKEWKEANVTPVHKKDSKELASNYRPISLLCLIKKVLERCSGSSLYCHIKNIVTPLQHGFMQNRSCVSQLLSVLRSIGKNLNKNIQMDILYLDFAKAFDSVDYAILLKKLKRYGIAGQLH